MIQPASTEKMSDSCSCTKAESPALLGDTPLPLSKKPVNEPISRLPSDLVELFEFLDCCSESIPLKVLEEKLAGLSFTLDDVREYALFDDGHYRRNLLHEGPGYHALLLCWKPGQRSPIHDHRGSACGVRVVAGTVLETVFAMTDGGYVYPTLTHELREGLVCATYDMDIHQISNLQPLDQPLVTLHIYSPPLHKMGTYSLTSREMGEFVDPVCEFEFSGGAGI